LKNINILSLVQAHSSLKQEICKSFLNYYAIEIKKEEIDDLSHLVRILYDNTNNKKIFNQFYVGYKIPQIGKEFDLLRFDETSIINIELKKTSTEEKIQYQLRKNKYYLSFIGKRIYNFSFIIDTNKLYHLNDDNKTEEVDFPYLIQALKDQKLKSYNNIDDIFNPSDYLVSPFNSTEKFINDEYFLTQQQEEVKKEILNLI